MRILIMFLIIIMIGVVGTIGVLELFEVSKFTSQDYTFVIFCGMIALAILNSFGDKPSHGKDN